MERLPEEILEMVILDVPAAFHVCTRLVCKKWNAITPTTVATTPQDVFEAAGEDHSGLLLERLIGGPAPDFDRPETVHEPAPVIWMYRYLDDYYRVELILHLMATQQISMIHTMLNGRYDKIALGASFTAPLWYLIVKNELPVEYGDVLLKLGITPSMFYYNWAGVKN